jgi:FG-GAP-like repeat
MVYTAGSLASAFAVLVLTTQGLSAGQFKTAVYYKAGQRPYQVVATHVTNSGNLDLVLADYLSNQIIVLLGNGDGTFQTPRKFSVPAPFSLAVGDLNGDGNPDLAVVESEGNSIGSLHLFLGDGTGSFHVGGSYRLGVEPTSVAIADFNGDGNLDVAVANSNHFKKSGSVMVFTGNGKGKLVKTATYVVAGSPWSIAARDLNGDKFPDLAVTQETAGSVAVLLNDGDGKFQAPVSYSAGGGETLDIVTADLRNDGRQDLVVANLSRGMVVLLNNGNGTFGKPTVYVATCHNCQAPEACTVADFNLDGNLDVACATNSEDSYFFYGGGNGHFGEANPINDTINFNGGYSIAAGDFNNDKAPDLAIPIELKGKVAIMLNTK